MKLSKVLSNFFIPLLIITTVVLIAFGRTLGSYFLEDDFGEVLYASHIFNGEWQKVIINFTGNYMEIPTMKVYRPFLLLSILLDYSIWQTKAYGYFITNILFLIGTALMLYLILRELSRSWPKARSFAFAFFSAILFAASPLHCESVSLMVGRVDIICAFFYLFSLWSFIRKGDSPNLWLLILGTLSFWLALLTKEMAIGLPIVLTAICFLLPGALRKHSANKDVFIGAQLEENLFQKIKLAIQVTYPIWISCAFYFFIRYLALGTFFGGYIGSVGANQLNHIFEKWTDLDTLTRIVFPLNKTVFGEHSIYHSLLLVIYVGILAIALLKIVNSGISRSWLAFLTIWILTTLIPIYQLWGLGLNLEGARFLFFLTMPLAAVLPLLVFAPTKSLQIDAPIEITGGKLFAVAIAPLCLLVILETQITAKNNIPWVHAGKQTKALLEEGQKLAENLGSEKKAIILGLPKEIAGAHVIYNGATFNFIMMPPFSKAYYADRFITFDPVLFGNSNLINTQRLRGELERSDIDGIYVWRTDKAMFEPLLKAEEKSTQKVKPLNISLLNSKELILPYTSKRGIWELGKNSITISDCQNGTGIRIGPLDIDPYKYDYMEVETSTDSFLNPQDLKIYWQDENTMQWVDPACPAISVHSSSEKSSQFYRFALSRQWRWFSVGHLKYLWLELPPLKSINLKNLRLLADSSLVPRLTVLDLQADNRGVYTIGPKGLVLKVDSDHVDNCSMTKLEISKPNYFFENLDSDSCVATSLTVKSSSVPLESSFFPVPGYYQIRAIGLNKENMPEGEWSDPITINFDSKML